MRSGLALLSLLVVAAITLAVSLSLSAPPAVKGAPHPEHAEMNQGGAAERHHGRLLLGWVYGVAQIGLFVMTIGICIPKTSPGRGWLRAVSLLYVLVFSVMMWTYGRTSAEVPFVFGFPLPTALLIFGMWPVSALFVVLYSAHFSRWIYSKEDAVRFEEIKVKYPGGREHGS